MDSFLSILNRSAPRIHRHLTFSIFFDNYYQTVMPTKEYPMIRTEISLFLKNQPGELGKMTEMFGAASINIDAITIQDASSYVKSLFKARGKSLKRIASAASYNSMRKDSAEFALIRLLPADGMTNKAIDLLSKNDYIFDMMPVIAVELENKPGELVQIGQ